MRKTLLLFTTMALVLLLAAGMAWAALPAPTVVSTVPPNGTSGVNPNANITATFSEAMSTKSLGFCNHIATGAILAPCPAAIPATVSYDAGTNTATLNPTNPLLANTKYTAVVE